MIKSRGGTSNIISGNGIPHGEVPHLIVCDCPASLRIKSHEVPKGNVIIIDIVPNVGRSCRVDDRNVLPDFLSPVRIGSTIDGCIGPKHLFPLPESTNFVIFLS